MQITKIRQSIIMDQFSVDIKCVRVFYDDDVSMLMEGYLNVWIYRMFIMMCCIQYWNECDGMFWYSLIVQAKSLYFGNMKKYV